MIVDEASGVDEVIFQVIDGVVTVEEARLLLIGNPLHARGFFYESHRGDGWAKFAVSEDNTPNVAGRNLDDPASRAAPARFPGLVTASWVWERSADWGEAGTASPDRADAPALAFAAMGGPRPPVVLSGRAR